MFGEVAEKDVTSGTDVPIGHVAAPRITAGIGALATQLPVDNPAATAGLAGVVLADEPDPALGILPSFVDETLPETVVWPCT